MSCVLGSGVHVVFFNRSAIADFMFTICCRTSEESRAGAAECGSTQQLICGRSAASAAIEGHAGGLRSPGIAAQLAGCVVAAASLPANLSCIVRAVEGLIDREGATQCMRRPASSTSVITSHH